MLVQPGYTSNECCGDMSILSNGRARLASSKRSEEEKGGPGDGYRPGGADRQYDPQAVTTSDDVGAGS